MTNMMRRIFAAFAFIALAIAGPAYAQNTPAQNLAQINSLPWTNGIQRITGANVKSLFTNINGTFSLYATDGANTNITSLGGLTAISGGAAHPVALTAPLSDTTSVLSSLSKFYYPTYYTNPSTGIIERFNRILMGASALGSGDVPMSTKDEMETILPNTTSISQLAVGASYGSAAILGWATSLDYHNTFPGNTTGSMFLFQYLNFSSRLYCETR